MPTGKVSVIFRSSFSRVSTVTAIINLLFKQFGQSLSLRDCGLSRKFSLVVRGGGLEPPHCFQRQDLNLVRLPISPPAQKTKGAAAKTTPAEIGQSIILTCCAGRPLDP